MTIINSVGNGLTGVTGSGTFVGATSPTLVTPTLGVASGTSLQLSAAAALLDANAKTILSYNAVANAVNNVQIQNNATGNGVVVSSTGSDTNINLQLQGKGTSGVLIKGVTSGNNGSTGFVGELISSVVTAASPVSVTTTATAQNVTSISLTAGDWDLSANIGYTTGTTTNLVNAIGWMSSTSATLPALELTNSIQNAAAGLVYGAVSFGFQVPFLRISISSTTTIYLSGQASFTVSTLSFFGGIYARRRR